MKEIEDFKNWKNNDDLDIFEDMIKYFNKKNITHWWEIAKEANKFSNVMFNDGDFEIEDDAPMDDFHCAITSTSAAGALESVAYAIGINVEHLEIALTTMGFYEDADIPRPSAIGFEALKKAVENVPAYLESNGEKPLL